MNNVKGGERFPVSPPKPEFQMVMRLRQDPLTLARQHFANGEASLAIPVLEPVVKSGNMDPEIHNLLGVALKMVGRFEDAAVCFREAMRLFPHSAVIHVNLAETLGEMQVWEEALQLVDTVLKHLPDNEAALVAKASLMHQSGDSAHALPFSERAIQTNPGNAQAMFHHAVILQQLLRMEEATACYRRTLEINPAHEGALANLAFAACSTLPFQPETEARAVMQRVEHYEAAVPAKFHEWRNLPDPQRSLRIGLVSADLWDHPVGYFIEGLLANSTTMPVTWLAFHNTNTETALTQRIKPYFEQWHVCKGWSDAMVCATIRNASVDVLVDLSGYTNGHRLGVFAMRPAPLQLTWLGYFGTTGLSAIDGVIADRHCVPPAEESWFSERVLRMPDIRYCMQAPADAAEVAPLPAMQNGYLTFGCFQALSKINDSVIANWARIAQQLPEARWRIQSKRLGDALEIARLKRRLASAGLDTSRVSLHGPTSRAAYLEAHAEVDVLLDTFPYPGGTTTVEALWMGVPTLTLALPGMLGRQGEAINRASGLDEWVATSEDEYVAKAVAWAQPAHWERLSYLRAGLRTQLATQPLFDQVRFARDWHALVRDAWREACAHGWPASKSHAKGAS